MAKDYARKLYSSQAWKNCRNEYARSKGYLCERCLAKGIFNTGEIVHHTIHIDESNINNPMIALNWDNLELVCRECHAELHEDIYVQRKRKRRYSVDAYGNVSAVETPPSLK